MPLQPHPYAYKTRMSAKRAPYLRPYSPPPLHLIDVVLRCAHRTTIYFGIDRFAFKFAIEDVLADAYDYGIDSNIIDILGEHNPGVRPTRCASSVTEEAQRGEAFESGRRGPTTTPSWCSRDFIGSSTTATATATLAASCAAAAGAVVARRPAALAAAVQQAATALGAALGDVKAAAQRGSAARRPQGIRAGAEPACGCAARSRGAARCPRVPHAPYGTCP